jgi:hypothetical protein
VALSDGLDKAKQVYRDRNRPPTGYEQGWECDRTTGELTAAALNLNEMPADEEAWRQKITAATGLSVPEDRRVTLTQVRYWGDPAAPFVYCRFVIEDRNPESTLDLDEIIRVVEATSIDRSDVGPYTANTALVVALADLQVGKVGSRGGTEELVERVWGKLDRLEAHIAEVRPETIYLIDTGDCVEGFENTSAQMHTNDLSFPEQLRVARRILTEFVVRLARAHANQVVVTAVPSNHGRWRRGKNTLGTPKDDFGLENLTAVADACALNPEAFGHVSFVVPDSWEESLALDIHGTVLGVVHGHQSTRPDGIPLWWAKQTHGGQPVADADILLTGHFHHLRVQSSGRSAVTKRSKWWIQAPTVDNGSDWFRIQSGEDSDPGLLAFTVHADGWEGLTIL